MRSFAPAQRRVYSNVGIELAADLVERATGMPFATYLDEAVVATAAPDRDVAARFAGPRRRLDGGRPRARGRAELLSSTGLLSGPMRDELATVQFPGLRGVLPGFGAQEPNDWGLGFEIRAAKSPHWTGAANSPATFGHFGQSGTMLWVDPEASLALVALADREFGDWARTAWPALSDAVLDTYA